MRSPGKHRIILGLMNFGPDVTRGARVTSLEEFKSILDCFQNAGYDEVDTAHEYVGFKQQAFSREAGWKERGLKLASKISPNSNSGGHDAANLREKCLFNLEQLGTDCMDILFLHAPDRNVPFAETFEECDKLYRENRFKQLGLSNYMAYEIAEIVTMCNERGWIRPTIYQGMYNCLTRDPETEVYAACKRYGIDVVIYNPLAGGLLSGKIKSKDHIPDDASRFGTKHAAGTKYRERYYRDATFAALAIVEEAAKKHDLTTIEVALRWCVHHSKLDIVDGDDGIIIGCTSVKQLEENLENLEKGPLPDDVVNALEDAWLVCKPTAPPYTHGEVKYGYDTGKVLFGK